MPWETAVAFNVTGVPVGQPRPRACIRGRRAGVYDPGTADHWRSLVCRAARLAAADHADGLYLTGPVKVILDLYFPRPRRAARWPWKISKPDLDNALKAVLDACTAAGIWKDDAQVAEAAIAKRYCKGEPVPGAEIEVLEWFDGGSD